MGSQSLMSFDIGPSVQVGPSFRFENKQRDMSDDPKQIQVKRQSQTGVINVEDLTVSQWWFPIHLQSVGSILVVGLVIVSLICVWRTCRKKPMIRMFHFCVDCRKSKAEREQERVLEMIEREAAAQGHEATTSHHHQHHNRGHGRGQRHARRGGHTGGLARGHGMAMESPRINGGVWSPAEESNLARAVKNNLECMARLAMPTPVHARPAGARPKEEQSEEDDINGAN